MADVATKLRFALALARNGFYIFPLRPNTKRPFKGSWSESMTRDPQTIREWFGVSADINYAVVPGDDYVILDIDAPKKPSDVDGREVWAELEFEQEQWVTDNTFTVKTPRGGFHYYLSVGQPMSNAHRFPEGIDVRGARGYALGPGSEIDGKDYTAPNRKIKIAPAPIWVVNRLRAQEDKDERHDEPLFELDTPAAISRASEFLDRRSPAIEGRNGNDHTYATICQVKDFGVSSDECLALLTHREGWNERCEPPWDASELAKLIDNAYRYGQHRPGAKGGALLEQFDDASGEQPSESNPDDPYAKLREITYRGGDILQRDTRREMVIPEWLPAHGLLAILAKRGAGKGLPVTEPVMTPWGWKDIGAIELGDKVCRPDGGIAEVIGVYPQGVRPCYELTFEDGAKARCDDNHLWRVHVLDKHTGSYRYDKVLGIDRVRELLSTHKVCVPTIQGLARRGPTVRPGLDYYLLGLLLGDGSFGPTNRPTIRFCTGDEELSEYMVARGFSLHVTTRKCKDGSDLYNLSLPHPRRCYPGDNKPLSDVYKSLAGLGLFGKGSAEKAVPQALARANAEQRLALLQGLMDTDGTVSRSGAEFCSVSGPLASQVADLARSLGARASVKRSPAYLRGVRHKDRYRVRIQAGNKFNPFRLKRKASKIKPYQHARLWRRIVSVEPIDEQESVCIKLDSLDGLFVTRDYVVTHNTVSMLDVALRLALDMDWHGSPMAEGWYAVYLCGEDDVGAEEQIRAWCRHHDVSKPPRRFIFLAGIVDLLSAGDTKLWAEYLKKEVIGAHKAIVFLDTWQRASSRGSQSDDGDMQLAVHHTEAMARSLGGPAVVAFHPPKHDDNVVMGSSIIENSTTAIWTLSENARGRRLEVSRIKGKGVGNYSLFQFEEVGLGEEDDFGRERSGIVPRKIGGTEFSELDDPQAAHNYQRSLAEVVREVDVQQRANDPKARLLTANAMAREIGNLPAVAMDDASEETREWASGLLDKLRSAGFTTISHRAIRRALLELFDDPRGHDFEDGYVLRLKSKGRQRYFVIEPSGI